MKGYLGEFEVCQSDTKYKYFTPIDWVEYFINAYGGIDGAHHKDWVLDQCMRIIKGTQVKIVEARWDGEDGKLSEYRVSLEEPSEEYLNFVKGVKEDGYGYEEGIAP